ncbi:hypothetical protein BDZ45DRAFT_307359 [Acephala macrosclerotiorum]|nr:hypothetical protein BDZ45DRAFT_307359 [Acephala macrosclerotiorum]
MRSHSRIVANLCVSAWVFDAGASILVSVEWDYLHIYLHIRYQLSTVLPSILEVSSCFYCRYQSHPMNHGLTGSGYESVGPKICGHTFWCSDAQLELSD